MGHGNEVNAVRMSQAVLFIVMRHRSLSKTPPILHGIILAPELSRYRGN